MSREHHEESQTSNFYPPQRLLKKTKTGEWIPITLRYRQRKTTTFQNKSSEESSYVTELYGIEYDDASKGKHSGEINLDSIKSKVVHGHEISLIGYDKALKNDTTVLQSIEKWTNIEPRFPNSASNLNHHNHDERTLKLFQVSQEGAGAFVSNLKDVKPGSSFMDALKDRYRISLLNENEEFHPTGETFMDTGFMNDELILGSSAGNIIVEAPGLDKVSKRLMDPRKLQTITLSDYHIDRIGVPIGGSREHIGANLTSLTTLDLSNSLFYYLQDLAELLVCLPSVRTLGLNRTRIEKIVRPNVVAGESDLPTAFENVWELQICECLLDQNKLHAVIAFFPALRRLDVADNRVLTSLETSLDSSIAVLQHLTYLNLSDCGFSNWTDLLQSLSRFPRLATLHISNNPLKEIPRLNDTLRLNASHLILQSSIINDWISFDNLELLTSGKLLSLKYSMASIASLKIDVVKKYTSDYVSGQEINDRPVIIAKLSGLEYLNGTRITPTERKEAEGMYMKYVERCTRDGTSRLDSNDWGRYSQISDGLKQKGEPFPEIVETVRKPVATGLKAKLITLHLMSHNQTGPTTQLSVLPSSPIPLLKKKIGRKFSTAHQMTTVKIWSVRTIDDRQERAIEIDDKGHVGWWFSDGDSVMVEIQS